MNEQFKQNCIKTIEFYRVGKKETIEAYNKRLKNSGLPDATSFLLDEKGDTKAQVKTRNDQVDIDIAKFTDSSNATSLKSSVSNIDTIGTNLKDIFFKFGSITDQFGSLGFSQGQLPTYFIKDETDFGNIINVDGTDYYNWLPGTYILCADIAPSLRLLPPDDTFPTERSYCITDLYTIAGQSGRYKLYTNFPQGLIVTLDNVDQNQLDNLLIDCLVSTTSAFLSPALFDLPLTRPKASVTLGSNFKLVDGKGLGNISGNATNEVSFNTLPGAYIFMNSASQATLTNVKFATITGLNGLKPVGGTNAFFTIAGTNVSQYVFNNCNLQILNTGLPFLAVENTITDANILLSNVTLGGAGAKLLKEKDATHIDETSPLISVSNCSTLPNSYPRIVTNLVFTSSTQLQTFNQNVYVNLVDPDSMPFSDDFVSVAQVVQFPANGGLITFNRTGRFQFKCRFSIGTTGTFSNTQYIDIVLCKVTLAPPEAPEFTPIPGEQVAYTLQPTEARKIEEYLSNPIDIVQGDVFALRARSAGTGGDTSQVGFVQTTSQEGSAVFATTTEIICYGLKNA